MRLWEFTPNRGGDGGRDDRRHQRILHRRRRCVIMDMVITPSECLFELIENVVNL
jgi:hypothetical protein